jgi:hypothetical protein
MDEILWVLNNERHCSGWHCDLVRHFWHWIMRVGSKLNGYGYEGNGDLHTELYRDDGKQTAYTHCLNSHYDNWKWGSENMQLHRVPYRVVMLFLIYNRHFIGNTDLLNTKHDRVLSTTTKATSRTMIMVSSYSFNKWFQVKYTYIRSC